MEKKQKKQQQSKIIGYVCGNNRRKCLGLDSNEPFIKQFEPIPFTFHKVEGGSGFSLFELDDTENSLLYFANCQTKKFNLGEIASIKTGTSHAIIKTKDQRIYGIGRARIGQLGIENVKGFTLSEPCANTFFQKNQLVVQKIACGSDHSYFLCTNRELYFCGRIGYNMLVGKSSIETDSFIPKLCSTNVKKFWVNRFSYHFFFSTYKNLLFARGTNDYSQLSLPNNRERVVNRNAQVPNVNPNHIVDMSLGHSFSIMILKTHFEKPTRVFACGGRRSGLGNTQNIDTFTEISILSNKNIIEIDSGETNTLARSSTNRFWVWGLSNGFLIDSGNSGQSSLIPTEIKFEKFLPHLNLKLHCGDNNYFIYKKCFKSDLIQDLMFIYNHQIHTDLQIIEDINVHKVFIEKRLKCKQKKITTILNCYNKSTLEIFFKSIYSGKIYKYHSLLIQAILSKFNLKNDDILLDSLHNDLLSLYKDNLSKKIKIKAIYKKKYEEEKKNTNKKAIKRMRRKKRKGKRKERRRRELMTKEEEESNKIAVHKFILIARSALFRNFFEMFPEINDITDYSGKSKECLQILIKYFYTNQIKLDLDSETNYINNNNFNTQKIVEELKDVIEYYQLNKKSQLLKYLTLKKINK
ncbi:claret [Anaeramoeba flamelloides]|uniref:Claret n=1 Tax=Anaeramoeba flamelloides TaxID=1746091 RepID=A0ABQ8Y2V4_9EUKA|nr:claret [Anaeramoeba flamelloides]